jgi:hypothetical protein
VCELMLAHSTQNRSAANAIACTFLRGIIGVASNRDTKTRSRLVQKERKTQSQRWVSEWNLLRWSDKRCIRANRDHQTSTHRGRGVHI